MFDHVCGVCEKQELCWLYHLSEFCRPLNVTISRLFVETSIKIMTNRGECRQVIKVEENKEQITMTKTRLGSLDRLYDI